MTITVSVTVPWNVGDMDRDSFKQFEQATQEAVKDLVGFDAGFYFVQDERITTPHLIIERGGQSDSGEYDYSDASSWKPSSSEDEREL